MKTQKFSIVNNTELSLFRENIIAELKEKIAKNPAEIENYRSLANYYTGLKDYNNAAHVYQEILKLNPDDFQSLINIGSISFYRKMYLEAIQYYKRAIDIDSENFAPYYNLGNIYIIFRINTIYFNSFLIIFFCFLQISHILK